MKMMTHVRQSKTTLQRHQRNMRTEKLTNMLVGHVTVCLTRALSTAWDKQLRLLKLDFYARWP